MVRGEKVPRDIFRGQMPVRGRATTLIGQPRPVAPNALACQMPSGQNITV